MNRPDHEEILAAQHRVFVRKARDAAHQALYFLGFLDHTANDSFRRAVDEYRPFALGQVQATVRGVSVPEADGESTLESRWRDLIAALDQVPEDLQGLRRRLAEFLDASRARRFGERLSAHWLPDTLRWLRRNLAVIWAWVLLAGVVLGVEAVRALLRNEGWRLLLPLVLLSLPLTVSRLWSRAVRARRPGSVPFWDFGGPSFRALRHAASEPGSLVMRFPDDSRLPGRILVGHFVKLGAYLVWWLIAFTGILFWTRSERLHTGDSSLTVFIVLSLFYLLLLAAYSLDFWDFLDRAPVRLLVLVAAGASLVALISGRGNGFFTVACLTGAAVYGWAFLRRRRRPLRLVLALLLAAIAVLLLVRRGTNREELWTDGEPPWTRLSRAEWPYTPVVDSGPPPPVVVMAASGGGSRAALYTGLTLQRLRSEHREIADQLQAISSVSGGSLANAAYVSVSLAGWKAGDPCSRRELAELDDAMGQDFLLPTIRGALTPGTSRGKAIENAWRKPPVCLGDRRLSDLAAAWRAAARRGDAAPPFPMPLFNSTTLDAHDVVITPLAEELYLPARNADTLDAIEFWKADDDLLTWVFDRDAIYSLEHLLPNFDPRLSSAVRASANFPFGFPLVEIESSRPLTFSPLPEDHSSPAPGEAHHVSLTDGGALSNSGMWSLTELLINRQSDLRERGVLLIIVEASKMPSFASLDKKLQRLWGTIGDQAPIGQALHRAMLDRLASIYGDRLRVVQIDISPLESQNVFTTWALDRGSIGGLKKVFDETRWPQESPALGAAWCHLTCREPAVCDRCDDGFEPMKLDGRRPPVD